MRKALAAAEHFPAYCIFPDKVLIRMAEVQPISKWEMLQISGVGENKMSKYGDAFLAEIRKFKGL